MSDVALAEKELADLQQVFAVQAVGEAHVRSYDLTRRIEREDQSIRQADDFGVDIATLFGRELVTRFGSGINVEFERHETAKSHTLLDQIPVDQWVLTVWKSKHNLQHGFIGFPLDFFYFLYNRYLGGGVEYAKSGILSPLEERMLGTVASTVLAAHEKCWQHVKSEWTFADAAIMRTRSEIDGIGWPPDFLVGRSKITSGEELSWELISAYPKGILKALTQQEANKGKRADHAWMKVVRKNVVDSPVTMTGVLGIIDLTFSQVLSMRVGDVYSMSVFDRCCPVIINGRKYFEAAAGVSGNMQAIKIIKKG